MSTALSLDQAWATRPRTAIRRAMARRIHACLNPPDPDTGVPTPTPSPITGRPVTVAMSITSGLGTKDLPLIELCPGPERALDQKTALVRCRELWMTVSCIVPFPGGRVANPVNEPVIDDEADWLAWQVEQALQELVVPGFTDARFVLEEEKRFWGDTEKITNIPVCGLVMEWCCTYAAAASQDLSALVVTGAEGKSGADLDALLHNYQLAARGDGESDGEVRARIRVLFAGEPIP